MVKSTLILVGPGGVGKGPLAKLIRTNAVTIDPYRLRTAFFLNRLNHGPSKNVDGAAQIGDMNSPNSSFWPGLPRPAT